MNKKMILGCLFTVFLIFMIPFEPAIEAKINEKTVEINNKYQIKRKLFYNNYQEVYKQFIKKDCNCYYYDRDNTLFCIILLLIIISLALIPAIGWIILIELDFGTIYAENCL